ncbi:glycoside hydrolase family 13 protein [Actinocatenispora comari]|uniref:Alpha-glucosidase n=1 Tax=Actinocatenispora comari TaxID=2807577 RepID=A0A8J4ENP9_9ACTN|nr:glycoside hydrolase family 13 protein [Actinocatenispora comari]GIL30053.1 alpha-glucosidase [Actinocatenispora comari]
MPFRSDRWWRHAVIYQVYPRSFADGNGDGIGDLAGIRTRLPYLAELGVDALWFSPWYPSPMADAGYDIADHRDIDPVFGTLAEAEALLAEAHEAGLRSIVDVVPNHCSTAHPWFVEAVAAGPGSAARELFWFRPGRGEHGELPPNDWQSIFGGPAWTRTTNPDGTGGEWYLHLFAPEQPDFNWANPKVREEFEQILRFWLDRGVDGIRIDSAALLCKDPELPDFAAGDPDPYTDRDELHEIYRSWRAITDEYGDRALIGEIWLPDTERFARYLRRDELHQAFNFDFLGCHWDAAALRRCIDDTLAAHRPVDAPATWVLSNHDVVRHVTRYGRADTSFALDHRQHRAPTDRMLGTRRARAAALLSLALPGAAYVYQGDELGLPEVEELADEVRQDPMFHRSGGADVGRDGCRVPLPWAGRQAPYGFSPAGSDATPWLPQPADWAALTAQAQRDDPDSMLALYRRALAIRRATPELHDDRLDWLDAPPGALTFRRGAGFGCVVNLAAAPVPLPTHTAVLLTSGPLADGLLPPDTAAWLRLR